ncbi:hypothetical protein B0J12DRAFT_714418 [Macrophomina phaseolina]|nr:hypothetical protein B0J12DRAFT_714418 [Macrophomina phaseolina]
MDSEPPRGHKRSASDALDPEHRLSKRFNLLNIDNTGKLYIPVAAASSSSSSSIGDAVPSFDPRSSRSAGAARSFDDDWMQLEDTKDKVYIYDLDKELAELESDEENPIFIPDIEKHLTKIPKHVLMSTGKELETTADNQLILYGVPASLTVPEEKDSVRKAIIEARKRAEQKPQSQQGPAESTKPISQSSANSNFAVDDDTAMSTDADDMEVEPMEVE